MDEIHKELQDIHIILYARPGKEFFYKKMGYHKMLTGMAKFMNVSVMREKGFTD